MAQFRGVQTRLTVVLAVVSVLAAWAFGNGGPFVVKYPNGDPAAKGVLARLDTSLKPRREPNLKVLKEDLSISFGRESFKVGGQAAPPLATVVAEYTIQNPTDKEIKIDFGFPILRGIYMSPFAMVPRPDVRVQVDGKNVATRIISNSVIYGVIRSRAREAIDKGIAADGELAALVGAFRAPAHAQGRQGQASVTVDRQAAAEALATYLIGTKKWSRRDAALMVAYAGLDFGKNIVVHPRDRSMWLWYRDPSMKKVVNENLAALGAIGEQKATQFFAQLARRFDKAAAVAYESIFTAWGGDIRERSVDLVTGQVRPREVTVSKDVLKTLGRRGGSDPTVYARVEYLDENAKLTEQQKAACKSVLKNLDVIFTFAPMNLLYYQATFPAGKTLTLTVTYKQYAYVDTAKPASYQLAYVVHPASLWDSFGPIALEVRVPRGVNFRASIPCGKETPPVANEAKSKMAQDVYRTVLKSKKGELLVAVDKASWDGTLAKLAKAKASAGPVAVMKK